MQGTTVCKIYLDYLLICNMSSDKQVGNSTINVK